MKAGSVQDPGAAAAAAADEEASERLFRLAAQYIVLAFALQPGKEVYRRSLGVVRELLPRPALRCGTLLAAEPATAGTCHERRAGRLPKFLCDEGVCARNACHMLSTLPCASAFAVHPNIPVA